MIRRGAAVLLAVLAVLLGTAGPAAAAPGPDDGYRADRVLIVGVPGLTWADVTPEATPQLWALAEESTVGAMSVRAVRATTCVLDGWATIGAGNRVRVPGPDDGLPPVPLPTVPIPEDPADPAAPTGPAADEEPALDSSLTYCGLQERLVSVGLEDPWATVQRTAEDRGTDRFGGEPAALGRAVGCATVVGRAPALAVAAPGVELGRSEALPADPAGLQALLSGCPLSLVSLDALLTAGRPGVDRTDDGTEPRPRAAALARIDEAVGRLRAAVDALPGETLLLLQGISEVNDGRPQLHVGMAAGPGFGSGWLTSASTGRAPYAQLIDVAPTALRALGEEPPASFNGQPMRATGERPDLAEAAATLVDANTAATTHHRHTGYFFWSLVAVSALVVVAGAAVLGLRSRPRAGRGRAGPVAVGALRLVALAAAALPVATYLGGVVPWERSSAPLPALTAAVLAADAVVVAIALLGPWRRRRLGPAAVVAGVTLATLIGDVLTGSRLELVAPLGYDPIVAGRFTGYGNLSFGLLSVSALLVAAGLATAAGRRARPDRARAVTGFTVLAVGVVVVGVIGAPPLGRDFGGVLAALPGFVLLAMLLTRTRVTVIRLAGVLAMAVLAVGTVAVLDWLRPAADRTHLGRFVEQVLTGEAWTVVSRKAEANLDIAMRSPLAWMLPVALVAAVWLVRPGGLLRTPRRPAGEGGAAGNGAGAPGTAAGSARLVPADAVVLRAALVSAALSLTLGAAVNDSGVAVPGTAATLLVPLMVWLATGPSRAVGPPADVAERTSSSGPNGEGDRVTVVSRGSTVRNA
ncbi:hypothetical protein [Trujillonella endophytica]|uniref:Uncharacterized protein n=1 Tax=Trujillonella endophytica TaxID=673521 RepID=A0A1H8T733_9ACTN|nr:hypothetical protein [Trujillella endophytica]SEO86959.1 hypothetical protein SAMN05660991_02128 [Trujillella endophytica]